MITDPIIAGALIGIALAIYLVVHLLQVEETEKRDAHDQSLHEAARDEYLNGLHSKYAGAGPHQYHSRRHIDFTGEHALGPAKLAEIKREVMK